MSETQQTAEVVALSGKVDALSESVNKIMTALENSPALRRAGYTTDDGGDADPTHKSFGDFLLAIKRNDTKRLNTVYGATKDMYESAGAAGGYLVPTEHVTRLMELAGEQSQVYNRVTRIPVMTDAGDFPVLNQFDAPTAGSGATYGAAGITADTTAELGTLTETQATFKNLEWRVHKIGGFVEVSNELIADSAISIEALLRRLFSIAIAAKNERNILRGSGAGEPLGILNSPVAVGITTARDNGFAYADALAMWARFKEFSGGQPVWIMHPSVLPDLGVFAVASGSPVVWAGNLANGQPNTLLGYPIILSEHMPVANGDDVLLADLSAYVMFERQGLNIAYSEHVGFTKDAGTWRFTARNDGQPWWQGPITLADPTGGYTLSPFVYHND
jgi:HK97 family phage major capsid protein